MRVVWQSYILNEDNPEKEVKDAFEEIFKEEFPEDEIDLSVELINYKGNNIIKFEIDVSDEDFPSEALLWLHEGDILITAPILEETQLFNEVLDFYLKKYPSDIVKEGQEEPILRYNSYTYAATGPGTSTIKVYVSDGIKTAEHSWKLTASNKPVTNTFDGATTDFSSLDEAQLASVSNFVLEKTANGKVDFGGNALDLRNVVDIDSYVYVGDGLVALNG